MEFLTKKVTDKYPDLVTLTQIYHELFEQEEPDGEAGDDKYRPLLLLLAILFKIQERRESSAKVSRGRELSPEHYQETLELAGYYWHLQHRLGKGLREGINKVPHSDREAILKLLDRNKSQLETSLGLEVPSVSVSELHHGESDNQVALAGTKVRSLISHAPDWVITVQENHKAVVLTVLGTRIFPTPNPQDVIMDMACRTEEFLDGEAHSGMVQGHRNLVRTALPAITDQLRRRPGFSLLVVGYSLGAALAQLLLLDLQTGDLQSSLPSGVQVRGLLYGVPPVYSGNLPHLSNVLMLSNHNDGITGASLKCLKDVMIKARALESLNLQRRVLFKMVLNIDGTEAEDGTQVEGNHSPGMMKKTKKALTTALTEGFHSKKEIMKKTTATLTNIVNKSLGTSEDQWSQVEAAVSSAKLSNLPELRFVGENLLVLKRCSSTEDLKVLRVSDGEGLRSFTQEVRFKAGMVNDHMPWAYTKVFSGFGTPGVAEKISLEILDQKFDENKLYPALSNLILS